ncbi:MAG: hypothetical protein LWX56_02740 [Ignavibacteria bacterium]|nr:hypothetical protein [Ignavibacteria bacterium]
MKKILIIFGLCVFLSLQFSCKYVQKYLPGKHESAFNGQVLQQLVQSAFEGNQEANDTLGKLFDYTLPKVKSYNSVIIDSVTVRPHARYYYVLLEFSNPLYNRFAVYDSAGAVRMIDKSLNGYLKAMKYGDELTTMLTVTENFKSKDVINLTRINFYFLSKDTVTQALRTFIVFNDSIKQMYQTFRGFSHNKLMASLSTNSNNYFQKSENVYLFDSSKTRFVTEYTAFDDSVYSCVIMKKGKYSPYQIVDKKSALISAGMTPSVDSVQKYNNVQNKKAGFSLNLPATGWKIKKDVYISTKKKMIKGTIYANDDQGAKFSVIELKPVEVAENFVDYELKETLKKFYTVRCTDKIEVHRSYFRYFEIAFLEKKFLVIFEAPKISYQKYGDSYETIMSSFSIDN